MPWVGPLALALAAFSTSFLAGLAVRPLFGPRASWRELHWTEQARRGWTVRVAALLGGLVLGVGWGVTGGMSWGRAFVPLSAFGQAVVGGAAAWLGLTLAGVLLRGAWERHVAYRHDALGSWAHILIARGHLLLILLLAMAVPSRFGAAALVALLLAVVLAVAWARGLGVTLARRLGLCQPATPELVALVARTAGRVGTSARSIDILRWRRANAFAFPQSGHLVFTEGALECLDDRGVAAVCAHELGHLAEPPRVLRRRMLQVLSLTPVVLVKPLTGELGPIGGLSVLLVVMLLLAGSRRFSQAQEEEADAVAHAHEHGEEDEAARGVYARTLEALYRHNLAPAVLGRGSTHPDLYDRMVSAGQPPEYPRPARPARWGPRLWAALLLVLVAVGPVLTRAALENRAWDRQQRGEAIELPLLALTGGSVEAFTVLAYAAEDRGDWWSANRFWLAAHALDPWDPALRSSAAYAWAREGDCDAAEGTRLLLEQDGWTEDAWFMEGLDEAVAMCRRHGALVLPPTAP